jgi:hypothetical protein
MPKKSKDTTISSPVHIFQPKFPTNAEKTSLGYFLRPAEESFEVRAAPGTKMLLVTARNRN